jgi:collagenase-like PrtC family protease
MAIDYVPDLIAAGVQSFKIEGRLKGPEYVGITTRAYRLAVDEAWESILKADSGVAPAATQQSGGSVRVDADMRKALKQVFSRGQDGDFDGLSAGTV